MSDYDSFASKIVQGGILTDPWLDGAPRFREEPVLVPGARARAMARAAEEIGAVYDEGCRIVESEPSLLDSFFALTAWQKAMWLSSAPLWHGIARADVFAVRDAISGDNREGLQIAELNCDTPTGEAEAVLLNALVAPQHPGARDPNRQMESRFGAMVDEIAKRLLRDGCPRSVGLVYPTEFVEDLSLVRLYRAWFEARGFEVVLGSPFNLDGGADGIRLFDRPVSIVLRHYKTDWWGERASAWDDETIEDQKPLDEPLSMLFAASLERRCAVVNPFGAVVPQNKRMMAFFWEQLHRFSPGAQDVIQRYVPVTARLEAMHEEQLAAQKDDWVIKSDYGAEGEEVILGRAASAEEWRATIAHARPGRWIAQRYFHAEEDAAGASTNYGVFLIAGRASGLYARVQAGATDDSALSAATLIAG